MKTNWRKKYEQLEKDFHELFDNNKKTLEQVISQRDFAAAAAMHNLEIVSLFLERDKLTNQIIEKQINRPMPEDFKKKPEMWTTTGSGNVSVVYPTS